MHHVYKNFKGKIGYVKERRNVLLGYVVFVINKCGIFKNRI